ncbi:tyrosine-type recombinase/integrase [Nocardia mangyaensis]|uniref:tyrosine-type recombinase/integrase n=1 Tax=Nocardia mangyaensis TaxID=2213200 RepID=UPI002676B076|nr:tyrosine-type recombinase/integrase [Nocardia mangyaensis]MDO3645653.1 tyrosine-type recombinase/integrase [Nocardia mangyaensis]
MTGRRTNGEGTLYQRKDGRWEGAAYLTTASGKTRRIRVYCKTRAEARERLTRAIEDARQGILAPDRPWKFGEYLDFWLEHEKRRPLTRKRHEAVVRLHIKPGLGHHRLNGLTVRVVQGFLDDLLVDGKSIATIHQTRKVLSAALTYAMRQEMIVRNVARLVELPRYKAKEAEHWAPDETVRFLNSARTDPLYPAFVVLALYGLRRGEVLGIRWRDVDFDHNVLHIRQQLQRIDGKLRQVEPKTESSRRDEPLLTTAREALLQQLEVQEEARAIAASNWNGTGDRDELVFTTRTGNPLESHNLARSFMRICKQNDLRRITIHGLRHSNATTQKGLHVHDRDIQAILGHEDVRTTGIYEHVDIASKRSALQKVEERLFMAVDNRERSRKNSRQTTSTGRPAVPQARKCKTPTPDGVGDLLGGSSQTRTGDTRLFRPIESTLQERLTSINNIMQARTRTWKFGGVAVKLAVKILDPHAALTPITIPFLTNPRPKEASDGPTNATQSSRSAHA